MTLASRLPWALILMASVTSLVAASEEAADAPKKPHADPRVVELTISPAPAPVPAFRHRLFPLLSERQPGDAAPIYLRLDGEFTEPMKLLRSNQTVEWLNLPLDRFPTAEARAFVDKFGSRLRQLEFGTRRRTCDWNYTLPEERDHVFEILLPDVQDFRNWSRLLALKARVEIAEGKVDEAIRTIGTGLAFANHIAKGPFLINNLVGVAMAMGMLDPVDELIARPGSPNLYWALTALPRPLIDLREAFENEQKVTEWTFPELTEVDRAQSAAEWSALLIRFHRRMVDVGTRAVAIDGKVKEIKVEPDPAKFRAGNLAEARAYLGSRGDSTKGMTDDQVVMLFFAGRERELRDDLARSFYLPLAQATAIQSGAAERAQKVRSGPLGLLVELLPIIEAGGHAPQVRLDRRVAILRAVEAVRMQASADGGKLPESLGRVVVVPVPEDPATGKPFESRLEGNTLTVASPPGFEGSLVYRIKVRR